MRYYIDGCRVSEIAAKLSFLRAMQDSGTGIDESVEMWSDCTNLHGMAGEEARDCYLPSHIEIIAD